MLYVKNILLPFGKTEPEATITKIKVWQGVIHRVEVDFPPGQAGLVKVKLYHGAHPIFPVVEGDPIIGDDQVVGGKMWIDLHKKINIVDVKAWNEDDTYNHTPIIRLWVLPKWVLLPAMATEGIIGALRSLFVGKK